jgi:hypothetical protein
VISNLVTGYFIQWEMPVGWEDVPAAVIRNTGFDLPPYFDINKAQAVLDTIVAFASDDDAFRLVGRPVSINQE